MTPIWNDEIERIKQDPEASVFLVSFASQTEARSTIHKLSFARQITKDGKTGLALPGHISFKVGRSPDGGLWLLLAGRMSTDESLEAYELFGIHGGEQTIVIPRQVQNRITGVDAEPTEIVPLQRPTRIDPITAPSEIKMVTEPIFAKRPLESTEVKFTPFVAAPAPKPLESSSTPVSAVAAKAQESIAVVPITKPVKIAPAAAPLVVATTQPLAEVKHERISTVPKQVLPQAVQLQKPDNVASMPGPVGVTSAEQPIIAKPAQESAEFKFTPFVAAPTPKPIEMASTPSPIAVTKVPESNVVVPEQAPVRIKPAVAPVVAKAQQAPIEVQALPVVVTAPQASPKVIPSQEPDEVVSVQEPVKVSSVQKVILPKPAPGTAIVKASPSPTEGSLASVAAGTATESAKVIQAPAKVTPTPVVTGAHSQQEVKRAQSLTPDTNVTQHGVRIYLAKEGARQGPFTLEHINTEIAAGRYKDDHFWAWHDGLPEWIPLYKVAGVVKLAKA